jgi:hypothetical protein
LEGIYAVDVGHEPGAIHLEFVTPVTRDDLRELVGGSRSPDQPLELRVDEGRTVVDVVGCTLACPVFVSDRFVEVLRAVNATGWSVWPVTIRDGRGAVLPGFQGLAITGRCGPLDDSSARVANSEYLGGAAAWLGLTFDPDAWDKTDVFTPQPCAHILVTDRVWHALTTARITNLATVALADHPVVGRPLPSDG